MQGLQVELPDGSVVEVVDAKMVPLGDVFTHRKITYTHNSGPARPSYRFEFEVWNKVPVCVSVTVDAKGGIPIRAKDLNAIKLENFRADAFTFAGVYRVNPTGGYVRVWAREGSSSFLRDRKEAERAATYRKVTPELLDQVASIHKATPTARIDAIAAAFKVSDRQAKRYIKAAREKGLIE